MSNSITILHLSDLQFGKNHRFAGMDLSGLENPYDTLLERLWDDVQRLRQSHDLRPDLVIVTGDLTEWGLPSEFCMAREFLEKLTDENHLDLSRRRVIILPGNHDVNRNACSAYFETCKGSETSPVVPWSPKWCNFSTMYEEFYREVPGVTYTPEAPWALFKIPDLHVVIAGLNSTMVEGHDCQKTGEPPDPKLPRHIGRCGEAQYRWFADRLDKYKSEGWFRIGAIHHNQQRLCSDDEENLEDADDLKCILGQRLNLLLHGHTHKAALDWLVQHTPIISTGSAALKASARPYEVPNQYQVLQITAEKLNRFGRAFFPEDKQFRPDSRIGDNDGTEEISIAFVDVFGAFPDSCVAHGRIGKLKRNEFTESFENGWAHTELEDCRHDSFLARAAEVCKILEPVAEVTLFPSFDGVSYLRVVERTNGIVGQYPVGVFEHGFTQAELEQFLTNVVAQYRAADPALTAEIVYCGEQPSAEIIRVAGRNRIRIQSFTEYQGLIDFTSYVREQTEKLERDPIYPPSLYVPQRMRYHVGQNDQHTEDALELVQDWLYQPHPRFVLILGDFGTGKTFLLHELARRMGRSGLGLTPLFVELRALEKAQSLDALLAQHLAKAGMDHFDLPALRYMLEQGRVVLFFDGFDELALRVSYDRAAEHFDTLIQAAAGNAKVVVTSRMQHFENDRQVRNVLFERAQPLPGLRYCKLQPFTVPQIKQFLINRWEHQEMADEWFNLLDQIRDLIGLSENPRMLGFITELKMADLEKAKKKDGVISAADLYRLLVERWLVSEYERAHPAGAQITLTLEARWACVTAIGLRFWEKTEKFVTVTEITEVASEVAMKVMDTPPPADIAGHLIGSGSLLSRDEEGCFFFVHQSVMEWLVAREIAEQLSQTGAAPMLGTRSVSPLMAEFLCDLTDHEVIHRWIRDVVVETRTRVLILAKTNALELLRRLGGHVPLDLAGQDLRGMDFTGLSLVGADLSGANLEGAQLAGKDLSGARLDAARLNRADLTRTNLVNASLVKADLTGARLLGAQLQDACFDGAILRQAALTSAQRVDPFPADCDLFGAAMPEDTIILPCLSFGSHCICFSWHPNQDLIATGDQDGTIRLWNSASGKELRMFKGKNASIRSVAFCPDGSTLASGGDDKTLRLWDISSGIELCQFPEHGDSISSVAFSPDGCLIASCGTNNTPRLWEIATRKRLPQIHGINDSRCVAFSPDSSMIATSSRNNIVLLLDVSTGKPLCQFKGHQDIIRCVAFSPDGLTLVSGSNDRTLRLWSVDTGHELRKFQGHQDSIRSVVFSPDGRNLASGSDDMTLRIWEIATGHELHQHKSHNASIRSVSFSADGNTLASGGTDGTVKLWETANGKQLHQLHGHRTAVRDVSYSPDGLMIASVCTDGLLLWESATGILLHRFYHPPQKLRSVAFCPDGRTLAGSCSDGSLWLQETSSGKILNRFQGHRGAVRSISFSPDGRFLASGGDDNMLRLWDVSSGMELDCFKGTGAIILSVAFSPDCHTIATGSSDGALWLWRGSIGRQLSQSTGPKTSIKSVVFSPDGSLLMSGGADYCVWLWEVATGKYLHKFRGHRDSVKSVAFSPDGTSLASGSEDMTLQLWDITNRTKLHVFKGHLGSVNGVSFHPDGHALASASDDGTVRVWDLRTGRCLAILRNLPEGWVAFTPEGRYKVGGNVAGDFWHVINLHRFEVGELDEFFPGLRLRDDEVFWEA